MSFFSRLYSGDPAAETADTGQAPEENPGSIEETRFRLQVEAVLNEVRPLLHADGGDIELVDIVGKSVKVRMIGACDGCQSAGFTLRLGVEKRLRDQIPEFGDLIPV